ncbi:hypothetical protein [Terribacillus saccharophilus]|uniref:hypothetical protein n=1 Tax=Terribacillus saccharophilus TaxID=361277 RepID=UPI000C9BCA31|nr:hypothetical protein [Terribacillus goriensis]
MLDEILFRYFRPEQHYHNKVQEAMWDKEKLLASVFSHTSYDELGLRVVTLPVEDYAIRVEAIDHRIDNFAKAMERDRAILDKALKIISKRQKILLFVYYQSGVVLTTVKELYRAKEHFSEALEHVKDKLTIR